MKKLLLLFLISYISYAYCAPIPGTTANSPAVVATAGEAAAAASAQDSWAKSPLIIEKATGALLTTSAGGGSVSVSNFPADYPLPAGQLSTLTPLSSVGVNNFPASLSLLNFGDPTSALRTASVLGNENGPLSYNIGFIDFQTLRTATQLMNENGALRYGWGNNDNRTLRTAAIIGNPATGAGVDFGAGDVTANTLRLALGKEPVTVGMTSVSNTTFAVTASTYRSVTVTVVEGTVTINGISAPVGYSMSVGGKGSLISTTITVVSPSAGNRAIVVTEQE